ncbi:hypothetical protein niasHT_026551 [Heterodera trifolii]|uniref:Uncharacterized protein n=1 Tax=Heterodera trifolii TaxID=157864 RepID=A0ABD2KSE2_9BILA
MSISFNSTINEFTPAADEEEVKGEVLENKETFAERRIGKLERENKELQEKLKLQQLMVQLNSLQSKVDKMEEERMQQKEKEEQRQYVYTEQFKAILEKISDLEGMKQKEEEQQKGMMKAAKNFIVEKYEATNGRMVEIEKRLKTDKGKYVSAGQFEKVLERTEKLEKQSKQMQQQQKQEQKTKFATVEKLEESFSQVGEMLKQQKQKLEQLDTEQKKLCEKMASIENFVVDLFSQMQNAQQTEIHTKIDEFAHQLKMEIDVMANATKTKVEVLDRQQTKIWDKFSVLDNFIGILKDRFENELLKAVHSDVRQNIAEKFANPHQNCWEVTACNNELEIFGNESLRIHYKGDGSGFCSVFAKYSVPCCNSGLFCFEVKITNVKRYNSNTYLNIYNFV